jgi:hypothetical protein
MSQLDDEWRPIMGTCYMINGDGRLKAFGILRIMVMNYGGTFIGTKGLPRKCSEASSRWVRMGGLFSLDGYGHSIED